MKEVKEKPSDTNNEDLDDSKLIQQLEKKLASFQKDSEIIDTESISKLIQLSLGVEVFSKIFDGCLNLLDKISEYERDQVFHELFFAVEGTPEMKNKIPNLINIILYFFSFIPFRIFNCIPNAHRYIR